jgi:hypothetical protein
VREVRGYLDGILALFRIEEPPDGAPGRGSAPRKIGAGPLCCQVRSPSRPVLVARPMARMPCQGCLDGRLLVAQGRFVGSTGRRHHQAGDITRARDEGAVRPDPCVGRIGHVVGGVAVGAWFSPRGT